MKKVIRLTEQDLVSILKNILSGAIPNLKDLKLSSDSTSDEEFEDIKKLDTNIPNKTTSDDEFYKTYPTKLKQYYTLSYAYNATV